MTARKANVSGQYTDGQRPNTLRPWGLKRAAGNGDSGKPLPDILCEKHRQQLFDQKTTFYELTILPGYDLLRIGLF